MARTVNLCHVVFRQARPEKKGSGVWSCLLTFSNLAIKGYLTAEHSLHPKVVTEEDKRILFGGPQCTQPYNTSRLNISAMSFGALSANAILALNKGAKQGDFAHNTGEGGLTPLIIG